MVGSGYKSVHLKGKAWLVVYLETEPGKTVIISAE